MQQYRPDWTWTKDVAELPAFEPGEDIEVMFHGGSTARGNLHSLISIHSIVAFKRHGKMPYSTLDTAYGLVWEERPGINKVDRSFVQAFG